jgi:hypothetical protein
MVCTTLCYTNCILRSNNIYGVHVTIDGNSIWYGPPVAVQFDRLESLYDRPNLAGKLASFVTATIKSSCSWTASMRKPDTATT